MIDVKKEYRTRCGHRVEGLREERLNARGAAVTFPIKGTIVTCEFPRRTQYAIWTDDGRYTVAERGDHKYDLLEAVAEVHDEVIVRKPTALPPESFDELAEKLAVPGHYTAGSAISSGSVGTAQQNSCESCGRNGDGCPAGECCYAYGDTDLWEPKKPLDVAAAAPMNPPPVSAAAKMEDSYIEVYTQLHLAVRWRDWDAVESVVAEMRKLLKESGRVG